METNVIARAIKLVEERRTTKPMVDPIDPQDTIQLLAIDGRADHYTNCSTISLRALWDATAAGTTMPSFRSNRFYPGISPREQQDIMARLEGMTEEEVAQLFDQDVLLVRWIAAHVVRGSA